MYLPSVGECTLRTIFLDMHAKEAHIHTINLLKGKKCFGSVGKCLRHFSSVHKPDVTKKKKKNLGMVSSYMWQICSRLVLATQGTQCFQGILTKKIFARTIAHKSIINKSTHCHWSYIRLTKSYICLLLQIPVVHYPLKINHLIYHCIYHHCWVFYVTCLDQMSGIKQHLTSVLTTPISHFS